MRAATALSGLLAIVALSAAHGDDAEHVDSQEPFIGWTQEDLDAKWGTDVGAYILRSYSYLF